MLRVHVHVSFFFPERGGGEGEGAAPSNPHLMKIMEITRVMSMMKLDGNLQNTEKVMKHDDTC